MRWHHPGSDGLIGANTGGGCLVGYSPGAGGLDGVIPCAGGLIGANTGGLDVECPVAGGFQVVRSCFSAGCLASNGFVYDPQLIRSIFKFPII